MAILQNTKVLQKLSCCVDHIYANFVINLGEEDLPDPLDARCSSWLGLGERCSSLYEMGHTYRYTVVFFNFSFTNYDVIYKLHFINKGLLVCFQDSSFIEHQTLQKSQIIATGIGNSLFYHFMFYPETTQQHNECV